jgi:hypothetical protein
MILVQNQKYRFSINDDGLIETFVAAYIGTEVSHNHGGDFYFFLVLQETLSGTKTTVAYKNILNVTPLANIDDLF